MQQWMSDKEKKVLLRQETIGIRFHSCLAYVEKLPSAIWNELLAAKVEQLS